MPVAGGTYVTALSAIGVLMYVFQLLGYLRCHHQNGIGRNTPAMTAYTCG